MSYIWDSAWQVQAGIIPNNSSPPPVDGLAGDIPLQALPLLRKPEVPCQIVMRQLQANDRSFEVLCACPSDFHVSKETG
jgi:hypothetical protein